MATMGGRNMYEATLFIIVEIYMSVNAIVGCISHNNIFPLLFLIFWWGYVWLILAD